MEEDAGSLRPQPRLFIAEQVIPKLEASHIFGSVGQAAEA